MQSLLQKLKINIDAIKMSETNENTPLHYSAALGRTKMCRLLIENGSNPNCMNRLHQTPLHLANKEEKFECVELLIAHGADPYIFDNKGRLPHHYCVNSSTEVKRILIEMEVDPKVKNIHLSSLHYMSSVGKLDFVKFLLAKGANSNKLNKFGCSPLHLAMFNGQIECANELVKNGAIVNNVGTVNLTPLDFYLNHIFNSIINEENINKAKDLEEFHTEELILKLKNGWKFSNYETILLLIIRNLDIENKADRLSFKDTKIGNKDSTNKQLISYFRKLKFISKLLGVVLKSERSMIQNIFLIVSQVGNVPNRLNDKNSVFWFLTQIINIILNLMHQVVKYKFELKQKIDDQKLLLVGFDDIKKIDVEIRDLFFSFVENLIKSGEIRNCRSFICQICSKWFYKNYTVNAELETPVEKSGCETVENIIRSLCFQYFEEMFTQMNLMLSQPSNLVDLCRIKIKLNVEDYPSDLDAYDSILPNYIKRFIRFKL